ncbi:hypothetical protein [Methylobacterium sp.]|uniref:hypothetical protein n=1 Tax=Methylobacterium sp. TaxID=409 RepID=UPI0025F93E5E|nr:hypothetical protein [Methylobacterium sp.]MBY0260130.1 hypothetical protein [Methylobacterium sp.]
MRSNAIPTIMIQVLPEEERKHALHIIHVVRLLNLEIEKIEADLKLFEYGKEKANEAFTAGGPPGSTGGVDRMQRAFEDQALYSHWVHIAVRDAALNIFHFEDILTTLEFKECPKFRSMVDANLLRKARSDFSGAFPDTRRIRDNIGHSGEFAARAKRSEENSVSSGLEQFGMQTGPESSIKVGMGISGNTAYTTYKSTHEAEASVRTFDLSASTIRKLEEIFLQVCAAFQPASDQTRALNRAASGLPPDP